MATELSYCQSFRVEEDDVMVGKTKWREETPHP